MMARTFCIVFGIVLLLGNLFAYSIAATENKGGKRHKLNIVALRFYSRPHRRFLTSYDDDDFAFGPSFDRTGLNFGVQTVGGEMAKVIPRLTIIPTQHSKVFTTTYDQQTCVTIQVFEGISRLTNKCLFLGEFNLTGIPPAPRGIPQIKVTFSIDFNYTLTVKAEEEAYGISEKITIPHDDYRVWYEDIKQLRREAEEEENLPRPPRVRTSRTIVTFFMDSNRTLTINYDEYPDGIVKNVTIPYDDYKESYEDIKQLMREVEEEEKNLKTYAYNYINDELKKEKEASRSDDDFEYVDKLRNERFKTKASTNENQIAEKESVM